MAPKTTPLPPGSIIGILGGGQLGRMLAMAAAELGYKAHVYCPEADCPASEVATFTTIAAYDDLAALAAFAHSVDVVTYEFENIPAAPVEKLASIVPVHPSPAVLRTSQDRLEEKTAINQLGIATAAFRAVGSLQELETAAEELGFPCVLKTARMGYDGKGQATIRAADGIVEAWHSLSCHPERCERSLGTSGEDPSPVAQDDNTPYILEAFIAFTMEMSVIVARDAQGKAACYCPVQNIHRHHILHETIAPAPISAGLAEKAEAIALHIAEGLALVGLMAVEMFVTEKGDILINELAPRPHNSGHWTLDACVTSQFEQTIRAVCGLPLGSPTRLCNAHMLNLIGDEATDWPRYAAMPDAKLHLYGKKEARPGRKMGHVTFLAPIACGHKAGK